MPRPLNVEERMVNRELKQLREENASLGLELYSITKHCEVLANEIETHESECDELHNRIDELLDALKSAPNPDEYKMVSSFMDAYKWWRLNIFEIVVSAESE